jgi:hypothetical protein
MKELLMTKGEKNSFPEIIDSRLEKRMMKSFQRLITPSGLHSERILKVNDD